MSSGLWLPYRYRNAGRDGMLTYLCWRDVSGIPMSEGRLRELAALLHTESAIRLVSVAGTILDGFHIDLNNLGIHREQQCGLIRELCEPAVASKAGWFLQNGRRDIFVHKEQLLIAAKLAILHGKPGEPETPVDPGVIGELLLGINEVIGYSGDQQVTPSELTIKLALRREALERNEQTRYTAGRYYNLLVTRTRRRNLEFESAFHASAGMSIEAYLGFALMYLTPFFGVQSVSELANKDFLNVLRGYEGQIGDARLRQRCQEIFSLDRAGFQAALSKQEGKVFGGSYLAFKEHPLYRLENGSAIPISLDFLEEKLALGPYWVLHAQYLKDGDKSGVKRFVGNLGTVFEEYLTDLLRRIYPSPAVPGALFYDESAIIQASSIYGKSNKPPFDAAIVVGDSLIIVEMFAGALALRSLEHADPSHLKQDTQGYKKKIKQLARAVKEIASGSALCGAGLDLRRIQHIYPVVALLNSYPQWQPVWQPLLDEWKLDRLLIAHHQAGTDVMIALGTSILTTRVYMPQIITAEEFEMIEPHLRAGSLSLSELLQRKLNDPQARYFSLKNFLLLVQRMPELPNEEMRILYEDAIDAIRAALGFHLNLEPPSPLDQSEGSFS